MKKRYLFLLMLFSLTTLMGAGRAYAQTQPTDAEYNAAMAAIKDGGVYYITTDVDGDKWYLKADGTLTDEREYSGVFTFRKNAASGYYRSKGFVLDSGTGKYFSNPANGSYDNDVITDTQLNLHIGARDGWEVQVFFLNANGKYAVRATNCTPASSGWNHVGSAFWTVIADVPNAGYEYEPQYIWELEEPTDEHKVYTELINLTNRYQEPVDYVYCDEDGKEVNIGTDFGQYSDFDTWHKFWNLLQEAYGLAGSFIDDDFDGVFEWAGEGECPTVDDAKAITAAADSMYQVILDSEVPYTPQDGYYRIIAVNTYKSTYDESGFVNKAIAASYDKTHQNKAVFATLDRSKANFLWKLTKNASGDSIMIQNAGMGTYISFSSDVTENKLIMTDDVTDASCVMFDYAYASDDVYDRGYLRGPQFVMLDGEEVEKDIFSIRLAGASKADNRYVHQIGHSSATDNSSIWGTYGTDSGTENELGFWMRTWNSVDDNGKHRTSDLNTSEWYLEYVRDGEAEELIESFEMIKNHDVLVAQNNALRAEVAEALTTAKDVIKTKMITSASQMSSPYSHNDIGGGTDGGNLSAGVLIDGDKSTYWHSAWQNTPQEPHYIQIADMQDMEGDCEFYLCERSADNDRPTEIMIYGTDDQDLLEMTLGDETWQDKWTEIVVLQVPNPAAGAENTIPFYVETAYPYIRVVATNTAPTYRWFWHAAELQIYTVRENPNSQFAALGEIAEELETVYKANVATADEDITPEMYQALLAAFKAFNAGMVDPTELRNALATYANVTKCVVEGSNPGEWTNTDIAAAFDELYKEVTDYDKAGRYTAVQNHKYAVMLKAMQKSVMEKANVVETDKWYHIMFPTEEMYTDYGFDPKSPGGASKIIDDPDQFGYYVVSGIRTDEMQYNDEAGKDQATGNYYLEFVGKDDVREGMSMYFANPEAIEDVDVSMFRFIEREQEEADYTSLFSEVKENMSMALDMSTTYTRGEALITSASQLSSNASDPSEGLHIEYLIDGNINTFWHSDYHQKVLEPGYIQVALNEPVSGLIQVDVTRRQGASNGHIVRMYIQGSNDGETWTNVGYLETPFTNQNESVTSQPVNLDGTYSYLRFTMTYRYGTDGGGNMEFDPFAEITSESEYNTKWTYFHAAEFQIYPLTPDVELSASGNALAEALVVANKVLLKDATAEDLAAAATAYKAFRSEFNAAEGKDVLPNGADKAAPVYAIQNKATGLFVNCKGSNNANNSLETIPTLFTYQAIGYQRSLIHGKKIDGGDCSYLHSQNFDHRFVTWNATAPNSNSGLYICEAEEEYAAPNEFTFYKDIKPGKIYNWCNSVTITPEPTEDAYAYSPLGQYTVEGVSEDEDGVYLALKEIKTIPAGEPAFYIFADTTEYDAEDDYVEPVKFTMNGGNELVLKGDTINGVIGNITNHTMQPHEIYFSGNHAVCIGQTGYYVSFNSVALDLEICPEIDPEEDDYDFSIFLDQAGEDAATGVKDISSAIEKISQRGNVYSMDGKLLRTGATLNSLKAMGKGMYILNGVKVIVK